MTPSENQSCGPRRDGGGHMQVALNPGSGRSSNTTRPSTGVPDYFSEANTKQDAQGTRFGAAVWEGRADRACAAGEGGWRLLWS
eukprot:12874229-Alexandrium_andersonii.AAC.1